MEAEVKNVIVEGMDASGKDTLIAKLTEWLPNHTLHERASTSLGGPVANLAEWVARDAVRMSETGPWIYNRHPVISEPIYGKYRPGKPTEESFTNAAWLDAYRRIVAAESVLIVCSPPYYRVRETLREQGPDAHMPGVYDNQLDLWLSYIELPWPGPIIRYDYTKHTDGGLLGLLRRAIDGKETGRFIP